MKTQRNILVAFLLNLAFAVFEFAGGLWTGSVAIISDALHDLGDAAGIGISWLLERKSRKEPDAAYTYGYGRFSVLGGVITMLILALGSVAVVAGGVARLLRPMPIHYDGMIVFAVVGVAVNFIAAFVTREGDSLNQKAVNLHMLEDTLGWGVVLVGAVVMRFTDLALLDPLMSLGVATYILIHACKGLWEAAEIFLERAPRGAEPARLVEALRQLPEVTDVHHIHLWTLGGNDRLATMHVVATADACAAKEAAKRKLRELGYAHVTLELETADEHCHETHCHAEHTQCHNHHHHHH